MPLYTPMASEEESELAAQILTVARCEQAGVLTAQAAIEIFGRSGLSFEQLRDIWNLADTNQSGELSKNELMVAIRLMGWVQAGETLHVNLVKKGEEFLSTVDFVSLKSCQLVLCLRWKGSAMSENRIMSNSLQSVQRIYTTSKPLSLVRVQFQAC